MPKGTETEGTIDFFVTFLSLVAFQSPTLATPMIGNNLYVESGNVAQPNTSDNFLAFLFLAKKNIFSLIC